MELPKIDLYRFDAVSVLLCIDRCTDERQPDVPCELSIIVPLECSSLNWDGLIGHTGVFSVCKISHKTLLIEYRVCHFHSHKPEALDSTASFKRNPASLRRQVSCCSGHCHMNAVQCASQWTSVDMLLGRPVLMTTRPTSSGSTDNTAIETQFRFDIDLPIRSP